MKEKKKTSENNVPVISRPGTEELPVLAAGLIHEVKNPLAAIHLHLQLLESYTKEIEDTQLREKIEGKARTIKKEILNLNTMLQDFIRTIKMGSQTKEQNVSAGTVIKEIIQFMEPQALREGIEIIFEDSDISESFIVEPNFFRQILINIILNAIQAFQGSNVSFEERQILIRIFHLDSYTCISVKDNGPGMSEEVKEKIFEPYFTTKKDGSGLGMSIVARMMSELNGNIEIRSATGEGTEILLKFTGPKLLTGN